MKHQIILVHGGSTFDAYGDYLQFLKTFDATLEYLRKRSWRDSFESSLGNSFEVVKLQMPNKTNARYTEWKLYFERYIPLFNNEVTLIGHSLGGIFLAKYLSENAYPKKIRATYLLATPYDSLGLEESLGDFALTAPLLRFASQSPRIFIFHSEDDPVVPVSHAEKYKAQLAHAEVIMLKEKKHLNMIDFPELVRHVKGD